MTRDVGAGGLCLLLGRSLPRGARVRGAVLIEGTPFDFAGVVVWRSGTPERPPVSLGVRFTGVSRLLLTQLQRTFTPSHLPRMFGESVAGGPERFTF